MTPKAFVENLQRKRSNYSDPDQAIIQANSIESLSTDIYTDRKRFLFELLQNADDASAQSGTLEIQFMYFSNWIVVSHKGEPFSEVDIESIASVGDGNKMSDENKTGFKGIGFKSVFSHSDKVFIFSNGYTFGFDRSKWESFWDEKWGDKQAWEEERLRKRKPLTIKMPWQIIPTPGKISEAISKKVTEFNVNTFIHYDDIDSLKAEVKELFSESNILLFLRCKNVKVTIRDIEKDVIEKKHLDENRVKIKRNGTVLNEWLIRQFQFPVEEQVRHEIQNDLKIPRKLRDSTRSEISLAVPIKKDKILGLKEDKRLVFSYLPTAVNYDFPFLVNSSFITDAGRQHLHEDTAWNQWLFKKIPFVLFEWLSELVKEERTFSTQILALIPSAFNSTNPLKRAFNEGFRNALNSIPFLPSQKGELLLASKSIYDVDDWCRVLGKKYLVNFLRTDENYTKDSFINPLKPISKLREIGVLIPDSKIIIQFFDSEFAKEFIEKFRENNARLIERFFEQSKKLSGEDFYRWNEKVNDIKFILDEEGRFRSPSEIFLPNATTWIEYEGEIPTIDADLFDELESNKELIAWLESIGVQEFHDLSFIEKVLIAKADTAVTVENAIELGRYLFDIYKEGDLEPYFSQLQAFPLLTKKGTLKPANQLFLADKYSPVTPMEGVLKKSLFCSPDYVNLNKGLISEWKSFLLNIGVKEKMVFETIEGNIYQLPRDYNCVREYFNGRVVVNGYPGYKYYKYKITRISFLEKTIENHSFAKIFWTNVLSLGEISVINIEFSAETRGFWGRSDYSGATVGDRLEPYLDWIVKNRKILPTSQGNCAKQGEVFANTTQIKEVAGKYLPVFDCDFPVSPEWTEYLGFKTQLQLQDYLTILGAIWQDETEERSEQKANQKRIYKVYEALLAMLPSLHATQKEELSQWGAENKLLSTNDEFYLPSELFFINVDDFLASADYKTIVKTDRNAPSMLELLRLFGVNIVENKKLKTSNDIIPMQSLSNKLLGITPLLNLVRLKDKEFDWATGMEYLENKLRKLKCYKTSEIEIVVQCGDEAISQSKRALLAQHKLYYRGSWENPLVLDFIVSELLSYLGLKKPEKSILSTLLQIPYDEGLEYLEELGYDITLIPEDTVITPEPSAISPNTGGGYTKSKEEIGLLGEQFTFRKLKRVFQEKYGKEPIPDETGFEIPDCVKVIWRNIAGVSMANHDFLIIEGEKEIYLDSKATPYGEQYNTEYQLTPSEFRLMQDAESYVIARVFKVGEDFEKAGTYVRFISMGLFDFSATLAISNS